MYFHHLWTLKQKMLMGSSRVFSFDFPLGKRDKNKLKNRKHQLNNHFTDCFTRFFPRLFFEWVNFRMKKKKLKQLCREITNQNWKLKFKCIFGSSIGGFFLISMDKKCRMGGVLIKECFLEFKLFCNKTECWKFLHLEQIIL